MTNNFRLIPNLDAAESAYVYNQLEQLKNKEFDVAYQLPDLFNLLPVDSTTNTGAEVASYNVWDAHHRAKIISDYADDAPLVNVFKTKVTYDFKDYASAYQMTIRDIKAAAYTNTPLEQRLLNTAADSILRAMNFDGWFGNEVHNVPGWLNNPNVNKALVTGANADARRWFDPATGAAVKNPVQILADMNSALDYCVTTSLGIEEPDTLVLPLSHFRYISHTPWSVNSDTSILQYFKDSNPNVTVISSVMLQNAFTEGANKRNGFIVYRRNPDKAYIEIPEVFNMLNPEERNYTIIVNCYGRFGGVHIPYPVSQAMRFGI